MMRPGFSTLVVAASLLVFLSAGCPNPGSVSGEYLVETDEGTRQFRMFVPSSYDGTRTAPLVIAVHQLLHTTNDFAWVTNLESLAEEQGFIVVFPDGLLTGWLSVPEEYRPFPLVDFPSVRDVVDDVAFVSTLIDALSAGMNIDKGRVYVCGASNGGMMSYVLASELSDRVAAVAVVMATMPDCFMSQNEPGPPIPLLIMHGTADPVIPYEGGGILGLDLLLAFAQRVDLLNLSALNFLSAEETAAYWASWNQTDPTPSVEALPDTDPHDGTTVVRSTYSGGLDGSEVVLYTINGGGHTWPGAPEYLPEIVAGRTCRDIDATAVIWEFFQRFRRE